MFEIRMKYLIVCAKNPIFWVGAIKSLCPVGSGKEFFHFVHSVVKGWYAECLSEYIEMRS